MIFNGEAGYNGEWSFGGPSDTGEPWWQRPYERWAPWGRNP